jgi:hypothetical protein
LRINRTNFAPPQKKEKKTFFNLRLWVLSWPSQLFGLSDQPPDVDIGRSAVHRSDQQSDDDDGLQSGLPDLFVLNLPKPETKSQMAAKCPKWPQNIPNGHKISQMAAKCSKWPQTIPKWP